MRIAICFLLIGCPVRSQWENNEAEHWAFRRPMSAKPKQFCPSMGFTQQRHGSKANSMVRRHISEPIRLLTLPFQKLKYSSTIFPGTFTESESTLIFSRFCASRFGLTQPTLSSAKCTRTLPAVVAFLGSVNVQPFQGVQTPCFVAYPKFYGLLYVIWLHSERSF